VSDETSRIVSYMCRSALVDDLLPQSEFWSAEKTKTEMCKEGLYFTNNTADAAQNNNKDKRFPIPDILQAVCADSDSASLALSALGACCWLLRRSLVDDDVFSMGKFSAYCPPDLEKTMLDEQAAAAAMCDDEVTAAPTAAAAAAASFDQSPVFHGLPKQCSELSDLYWVATGQRFTPGSGGNVFKQGNNASSSSSSTNEFGSRMLLDGAALTNLEVLLSTDGDEQGSLFKYLNRTNSAYGKRLLKEWVCAPLLSSYEIEGFLKSCCCCCFHIFFFFK
jgi:hypothetical protein